MKFFSALSVVISLLLCSCERHEWETEGNPKSSDTINLFKHEDHSGDEHASDDHGHAHEAKLENH